MLPVIVKTTRLGDFCGLFPTLPMILDFLQPKLIDHQAFLLFYDRYAPGLWELILRANLPTSESKKIIVRTFMKAWRHPDLHVVGGDQAVTWLLSLAYAEGLPYNTPEAVFERI